MSDSWLQPDCFPEIGAQEVHCWLAHLPAQRPLLGRAEHVVSPDERERLSRFRFDAHRERALLTRSILRWLIGGYLQIEPGQVRFRYGPHGKPALDEGSLEFNTSHSGDYAAFAFTRAGQVGVDIEAIRVKFPRRDDIAAKHFAPGEQAQLRALDPSRQHAAFFDLWTRKEAFIKARGDGLFSGLDRFEVSLQEPRVMGIDGDASRGAEWRVVGLPPIPGYSAAAVIRATEVVPRFWTWTVEFAERLIGPAKAG